MGRDDLMLRIYREPATGRWYEDRRGATAFTRHMAGPLDGGGCPPVDQRQAAAWQVCEVSEDVCIGAYLGHPRDVAYATDVLEGRRPGLITVW